MRAPSRRALEALRYRWVEDGPDMLQGLGEVSRDGHGTAADKDALGFGCGTIEGGESDIVRFVGEADGDEATFDGVVDVARRLELEQADLAPRGVKTPICDAHPTSQNIRPDGDESCSGLKEPQ